MGKRRTVVLVASQGFRHRTLEVDPSVAEARRVFRYFDSEEHADALCKGDVWVSTLEECRKHDRAASRDEFEGKRDYRTSNIIGDSDDPKNAPRLERLGFKMPFKRSALINMQVRQVHPDAFVLCTTLLPDTAGRSGFGQHGVENTRPARFFERLSVAILQTHPIASRFAKVVYAEPVYGDLEPEPGHIAFTKRPDPWEREQEARMLFTLLAQTPIAPGIFKCPNVSGLCRRIS